MCLTCVYGCLDQPILISPSSPNQFYRTSVHRMGGILSRSYRNDTHVRWLSSDNLTSRYMCEMAHLSHCAKLAMD